MNGNEYSIQIQGNTTVSSIQPLIEEKTAVPIDNQRLLHKSVLLQPNKLLSDYGINDGNTIHLVANILPEQFTSPSISTHRQSEVARTQSLTQQNVRTRKYRYLQQRLNGFNIKSQQSIQTIKQNKMSIDNLIKCINQNKEENRQPFLLQNRVLQIGDWVDVRDVSGLWIQGQVVCKKHNFVQIHCNGYPDKWNQWIDQTSERIMPLRTQTVQLQQTSYLSPFPLNKPQIKTVLNPQQQLQKLLSDLPLTINMVTNLINELCGQQPSKIEYQYEENQIAESFKNNRSHNSPPQSIHEEDQYDYQPELENIPVNVVENKQGQCLSTKGKQKKTLKRKFIRSNRYIDTKNSQIAYLGYSKTKSQHEHKLKHRQQTPNKNGNVLEKQRNGNVVAVRKVEERSQQGQQIQKQQQIEIEEYDEIQKTQNVIPNSANKQSNIQADNISNKCQQNMSNKGQHDDGQSSAKSFGSKRSDRFLDASSMKSLNIDTLHNNNDKSEDDKIANGKKNIFLIDHMQAQSVRSAVQNQDTQGRTTYYFNQEGILQEEDSQLNEQINEQYYVNKKKQALKKLRATQLAPLCDRLGRLLIDLAPNLAQIGYSQYNSGTTFNENLSTFTNQGSLQSRLKNISINEQQQEIQEKKSVKYCNYQIPVMLSPFQILKINKLLAEQQRQNQ